MQFLFSDDYTCFSFVCYDVVCILVSLNTGYLAYLSFLFINLVYDI